MLSVEGCLVLSCLVSSWAGAGRCLAIALITGSSCEPLPLDASVIPAFSGEFLTTVPTYLVGTGYWALGKRNGKRKRKESRSRSRSRWLYNSVCNMQ